MRTGMHIVDEEFPDMYSWLKFFSEHYDNAAKEVQAALHGIVEAYIEKKASEHIFITEEEALAFLTTVNTNPRNAGRKPKFSAEQQSQMLSLLESGSNKKEIAEQFHCSVSYVEKLWHRHNW